MDFAIETSTSTMPLVPAVPVTLETLADRLRSVRHQLSRGRPLAGVFDRPTHSPDALRAVQRLDHAVARLSETVLPRRMTNGAVVSGTDLPWLVRIVERRADALAAILSKPVH